MTPKRTAATSIKLIIPSEIKLVDLVHAASEKMAEVAGFDADEALNVGLAVREAVINAIVHGNGQDAGVDVAVTITVDDSGLEARIRDHGNGFDPDGAPDPTDAANLLNTSGRGILLIRAFMDGVSFRRCSPGMEITLTKHRSTGDSQAGTMA